MKWVKTTSTVSTSKERVMSGIPRIKVNNFSTFYYQYEYSLLDAMEAQEIPAPYNCRGGYCGCCRVRLIDGEVKRFRMLCMTLLVMRYWLAVQSRYRMSK